MKTKRKKILVYSTIFSNGGAERFVLDFVNNLHLKKYDVVLVIGRKNGTSYLSALKNHSRIKYINLNSLDGHDHEIYLKLGQVILKEQPDICFAPGFHVNFILLDALKEINYQGKCVVRSSNYISLRNINEELALKIKGYNNCDAVVSLTKGMKKDLVKYGVKPSKILIIKNTVEIKEVVRLAKEEPQNKEFNEAKGFKIVQVGRLEDQKNHKMLLSAFKKVVEELSDLEIHLFLLGKGTQEPFLREFVLNNHLEKYVHFLGFQENPYSYLKRSDLFVLSSLYEGLPHTILEALTLKVPVLSTNCPTGPYDILKRNKFGYLVKNNDASSMAKEIIKLIKNPKKLRKKVEKGYQEVQKYDARVVTREYENLFEKLLKEDKDVSKKEK